MRAAVVIPAFQADRTLGSVVARLPSSLSETVERIWIVDDGSHDRTAKVARDLARADPRIRLLCLEHNLGYGGALKAGLRAARAEDPDAVACLHADGQYAPEELPRLLAALAARRLDLLQGSRIASGTALSGGMPRYKYLAGLALTALENHVFQLRLTDYHSGYLLYGRRALRQISFDELSDSFDFDLEVIASARAQGLSIGEAPIPTHYGEEVSYLNPVRYGLRVLRVVLRYHLGRYR